MSTPNAPQVTKVWDSGFDVVLKVTAFYTGANTAANTLLLAANTVNNANNSVSCVVDVVSVQFEMALANGYVQIEYGAPSGNTTSVTMGKDTAGGLAWLGGNPIAGNAAAIGANVQSDLNLVTSGMDANDTFTLIVNCRKNNFNNAFANANQTY